MKPLVLIAGLMTALGLAVLTASASMSNFAGTWVLDKAKSQGLAPRTQGADKITWTITQDDKTVSILQKIDGVQPAGGARPPARPAVYDLDGKETTSDITGGPLTGKETFKAAWAGNSLELSRKVIFTGAGEVVISTTQRLSLSSDGRVLTAIGHGEGSGPFESRGGPFDSTLVFNKQ